MTTPAASKELNYMLAHIEDDKLVEDPDDPTFDFGGPGNNFNFFIAPIRKQRLQIHHKWVPEKSFPVLSDWRKTRIPSVLVIHNGPNVQALGAVYLTNQYVEVLSPSLPLYFSEFMTALRNLFRSLLKVYEKPNEYAFESDQASFPYPRSYRSFGTTVQFTYTYIKRVIWILLVFTARTEGDQDVIVKFGYGPYGLQAYHAAAESGFASALLSRDLPYYGSRTLF
ncbi:hypothetical protein F5876DRAFT_78853 [Lentinula aff. lateritia]|uniref:Uncharacterized protein n=1 Tax=Lentinula aff. lateritia TaxID=2804960 RepID=A0ACC1TVF5_9AGAR|nr:hypothetical protein F5876DRAFT_78853 [Lentinula aff. lateritia]